MPQKNGFAISDSDRRLIRENSFYVREALFACMTDTQVECSVAFARYLNRFGINSENYWLFLRLVMTNNPWVIDELLHDREPGLLFSTIRPDAELIEAAFQILYSRHPEELYPPALEALIGIVQGSYFDPDDGYRIRRLSVMDINALGKFLLKDEPQENPQNRLILEVLDRITHLGEYYGEQDKSVIAKHAFNVRFAYFDSTRNMVDAIPQTLLVRVPDHGKVRPEEDFADLVAKRRARKRDAAGRFMREDPPSAPPGGVSQPDQSSRPAALSEPSGQAAFPSGSVDLADRALQSEVDEPSAPKPAEQKDKGEKPKGAGKSGENADGLKSAAKNTKPTAKKPQAKKPATKRGGKA